MHRSNEKSNILDQSHVSSIAYLKSDTFASLYQSLNSVKTHAKALEQSTDQISLVDNQCKVVCDRIIGSVGSWALLIDPITSVRCDSKSRNRTKHHSIKSSIKMSKQVCLSTAHLTIQLARRPRTISWFQSLYHITITSPRSFVPTIIMANTFSVEDQSKSLHWFECLTGKLTFAFRNSYHIRIWWPSEWRMKEKSEVDYVNGMSEGTSHAFVL